SLVEILGDRHCSLRGESEFAASLLLHRGGAEGCVRAAAVRLGLDTVHLIAGRAERVCKSLRLVLIQQHELIMIPVDHGTTAVEIAALGDPSIANPGEP